MIKITSIDLGILERVGFDGYRLEEGMVHVYGTELGARSSEFREPTAGYHPFSGRIYSPDPTDAVRVRSYSRTKGHRPAKGG